MTVKELIKKLQTLDQDAIVISKEYTGCDHTAHIVDTVIGYNKYEYVAECPGGGELINKDNKAKESIVFIN